MTFFVGDLSCTYFQVLLKPIVSQLVIEPPLSLMEHSDIPSVEEVDDLLVVCIGQMAVTAGSDLLWKPLNYEVMFLYIIVSAYSHRFYLQPSLVIVHIHMRLDFYP